MIYETGLQCNGVQAANASLQQRLAEAAVGSPKQESSGSFELQARLESTEARCMELEQGARHSQHRVRLPAAVVAVVDWGLAGHVHVICCSADRHAYK